MKIQLSQVLVVADQVCDYIPFVSSVTNISQLVFKFFSNLNKSLSFSKEHFFSHLKEKHVLRCVVLLIPGFGNLFVT